MNKENLKKLMIENKLYLRSLFKENIYKKKKQILLLSDEKQIDLILNILFYVVQGDIPLKKIYFEKLKDNKKLHFINRTLNSQEKLDRFLKSTLKNKYSFMLKLLKMYNDIFYFVFCIN